MQHLSVETLEALKVQLFCHEGFSATPYSCTAGKLTIGIGRNLEDKGITQQEAEYLLDNDIRSICGDLARTLPVFAELSDVRKQVLVNMAFNLGVAGLCQFKNMLAALDERDFERAKTEMLNSRWAMQVGLRAHELADMMLEG